MMIATSRMSSTSHHVTGGSRKISANCWSRSLKSIGAGKKILPQGLGNLHYRNHLLDIVDADNVSPAQDRRRDRGGRRPVPLFDRHGSRRRRQERLSRGSDEDWQFEGGKRRQARQHGHALIRPLRKADPRVDDQPVPEDAESQRAIDGGPQV